jgi:hypothetical protein
MIETDDLTVLTVNLVPSAVDAMTAAAERCGDTRTDTVNRALQLYDVLIDCASTPGSYAEVDGLWAGQTYRLLVKRRRWWQRRRPSSAIAMKARCGGPGLCSQCSREAAGGAQ